MKITITYFGLLVLLALGISNNSTGAEIVAGLGLVAMSIYSFATFSESVPINDPINSSDYLDSNSNQYQGNGGHDNHNTHSSSSDSGGHGGSHDFGDGIDHGGGSDGGGSGDGGD